MDTLLLSILACSLVLAPALKIIEFSVPTKVTTKTNVTLDCLFDLDGDTLYSVKWYKDNMEFYRFVPSSVPHRILHPVQGIKASFTKDSNSSVTLNNVSRSASGQYRCEVSADAPSFHTASVSEDLLVVGPSDPPRHLKVIETASRSVTLTWTEPQGDDVIRSYKIQHKKHELNWNIDTVSSIVPGKQTTVVVSDLEPFTTYDFRVSAETTVGRSRASDPVKATTSGEAPGGPPLNISAQALGLESVKVTWMPPSKNLHYGPIRGYYVGYRLAAASSDPYAYKTVDAGGQESEETILTSLLPSTRYGVIVQAFNDHGAGPPSAEIVVETLYSVHPTPPQLSVVSTSSTSVSLEWKRPAGEKNPVEGYHVLHRKAESGDEWNETHVPGDMHSLTIDQLKCGFTYQFVIRAYNDAGTGNVSDAVIVKTKGTLPVEPPEARLAVLPYTRSALIQTMAWHDGGCPIERFTAKYRPQGGAVWTTLEAEQPAEGLLLELRCLSPASIYKVVVTAYNSAGATETEFHLITLAERTEKPLKIHVPPFGQVGSTVRLDCSHDLGNAATKTIRWFKDGQEFYRFASGEKPSLRTFDVEGMNVNMFESNASSVYLEELGASAAGTYSCEASSETPLFHSTAGGELVIAERLPATPRISAVIIGDTVRLSCISVRSKPSPRLSLFVNGQLVNNTTTRLKVDPDGLSVVSARATFELGEENEDGDYVRVRCEALFSDAFAATVEENVRVVPRRRRLLSSTSSPRDQCAKKALKIFQKMWVTFSKADDDSSENGDRTFSSVQ